MSVSVVQRYTDPATGTETTRTVTVDIKRARLDATTSDSDTFVLESTGSGVTACQVDISKIVQDLLDGKPSRAQDSKTETYLTAAAINGQTVVSVESTTGFAAGDPVAFKDLYDDTGTSIDYAVISAISGSALTVSTDASGTGLGRAFKLGAIIQNLKSEHWGASTGLGGTLGVKSQSERPVSVSNVKNVAGGPASSCKVSWTESSSVVATHYDIYVSRARLNAGIAANRRPIYMDFVYSGNPVTVTQYNEADNVAYNLQSGVKFYVYVVPKTGTGQFNIDEGAAVEKHYNVP